MITSLLVLAAAVLCWPIRSARRRLHTIGKAHTDRRPTAPRRPAPLLIIGLVSVGASAVFGLTVGLAVTICVATARGRWKAAQRTRRETAAIGSMAEAITNVVAELRTGAHPVVAVESAADDAGEPVRTVLTAVASTARLGGDPAATLARFTDDQPALAGALRPLANGWSLAQRHGLPLADMLAAVQRDMAERARFLNAVRARMAGPRASGSVLAALPILGILLGEGMGAQPLHVLFATSLGQSLLLIGTALACAGVVWIARLTSQVVAR